MERNILFLFVLGSIIGSFISMLTHRLIKNEDIVFKSSYCPNCKNPLNFWQLIPILGYLLQFGKCKQCNQTISKRYILIELSSSTILILISLMHFSLTQQILYSLIFLNILAMCITDLENLIVPDSLQASLFILSCISFYYLGDSFISKIIFIIILSSLLYFTILITKAITKKNEVMGGADLKFLLSVSLLINLKLLPFYLFFCGFLGVVLSIIWKKYHKNDEFPFIPPLAISLFICLNYYKYFNNLLYRV